MMLYDQLKKEIETAPVTWIPSLLRAAVETAIKNRVFVEAGLLKFVTRIVDSMKK